MATAQLSPRHRKLAMWGALPPYLGGKRRLCPTIFREIDRLVPRAQWGRMAFLDAFLGGGSVSLFAKAQGFRVTACDIAERAIVVGEALIANSRVRLTREDVLKLARDEGQAPGPVETRYCPSTFTRDQARLLDRALVWADENPDPARAALYRLLAIRVALLAHPMSQVRKGTIHRLETGEYESITESCMYHYVDGLRLTRPNKLWELAQQINAGVFQGEGRVLKRSVLEALPEIEATVAYFDPPYPGVMSYEKEYAVLDEILEGGRKPTSPFTAKDGASMIDSLLERARHIPVWVLSLGNAVVTVDELEAKMVRLGRKTKAMEIRYLHLAAVATEEKKRANKEFLVIGWDPSVLGEAVHHAARVENNDLAPPLVEPQFGVASSQGSAPKALADDGIDQGQPTFPQEGTSHGRVPVPVANGDLHDPDPVGAETGVAGDGEGLVVHSSDVPLGRDPSQVRKG